MLLLPFPGPRRYSHFVKNGWHSRAGCAMLSGINLIE